MVKVIVLNKSLDRGIPFKSYIGDIPHRENINMYTRSHRESLAQLLNDPLFICSKPRMCRPQTTFNSFIANH